MPDLVDSSHGSAGRSTAQASCAGCGSAGIAGVVGCAGVSFPGSDPQCRWTVTAERIRSVPVGRGQPSHGSIL
eukprot:1733097-Prymnesium_polylepis.2